MYVTRFKEDFGWDYQLMDVKTKVLKSQLSLF